MYQMQLERLRALNMSRGCEVISSERGKGLVNSVLDTINFKDLVCYGGNDYTMASILLKQVGKRNFILIEEYVQRIRQIKDKQEIEKMMRKNSGEICPLAYQ